MAYVKVGDRWMKKRPSGNCPLCGIYRPWLQKDHIIPKRRGGLDEESNIQWICANCHEDKTMAENMVWRPTEEQRYKMGSSRRGKKFKWSDEVKSRISESLHGNKCAIGHKLGELARREIGQHAKKRWASLKSNPELYKQYLDRLSAQTKHQWKRQRELGIGGRLAILNKGGAPDGEIRLS